MTESYRHPMSAREELISRLDGLFEVDAGMLAVDGASGEGGNPRIRLVVTNPETIEDDPTGRLRRVRALCHAYTVEAAESGYVIASDYGADVQAAPTDEERKHCEDIYRRSTRLLYLNNLEPDTLPRSEAHTLGEDGKSSVGLKYEVDENHDNLRDYLRIVANATVYNPQTHGILRAPRLPDGQRAAGDRLATLPEIVAHKKRVWLSQQPFWRRLVTKATWGRVSWGAPTPVSL